MSRLLQFRILVAVAGLVGLLSCQASGRPSIGLAKDDRDVAAIGTASRPTREEIRDRIVAAAKTCWLNNKTPAFAGLALRSNSTHPIIPNGYYLTFGGAKNSPRYLNIHIIPADHPDGGYMVYVDQENKNTAAVNAIEEAIDRLEANYSRSLFDKPNQPLC